MISHTIFSFLSSSLVENEERIQLTFIPDIFCFKKGEETFAKEFDVVEFARTQRKLKMLMHLLMDESERFLAPYQKLNAISLLSESDNQIEELSYKKIPNLLSNSIQKKKHNEIVDQFFVRDLVIYYIQNICYKNLLHAFHYHTLTISFYRRDI